MVKNFSGVPSTDRSSSAVRIAVFWSRGRGLKSMLCQEGVWCKTVSKSFIINSLWTILLVKAWENVFINNSVQTKLKSIFICWGLVCFKLLFSFSLFQRPLVYFLKFHLTNLSMYVSIFEKPFLMEGIFILSHILEDVKTMLTKSEIVKLSRPQLWIICVVWNNIPWYA